MSVGLQETRSDTQSDYDLMVAARRATLASLYDSLPPYGSPAFWQIIEESDEETSLPLEILVKCTRFAVAHNDYQGRNRIIEVIFRRTAVVNEYWANAVLAQTSLSVDEQRACRSDLYADLCERVIRAILDESRGFWEENFQHSLLFERKHVFTAFLQREGRWRNLYGRKRLRTGHLRMQSLEQGLSCSNDKFQEAKIEDQLAQKALLGLEHADLLQLILHLPDKLKAVVLLIFWEDKTEKDTARVLGVTDRTVRNRLRAALKILHEKLLLEREYVNG